MTKEQDSKSIRELGVDPETGKSVTAALDRYGAYVCIGNELDREFMALTAKYFFGMITLDEALKLFKFPRNLGQTPLFVMVIKNIFHYLATLLKILHLMRL